MKVTTISEVFGLDHKDIIKCLKGTVKKVWPQKAGKTKDGKDWTVQTVVLTDTKSDIDVTVWNKPEMDAQDWEGESVYIQARQGEKGWSGVYAEDNTYTPKGESKPITKRVVKVSDTGEVIRQDEAAPPSESAEEDDLPYDDKPSPPAHRVVAPTAPNANRVPGPTVGMALNNAIEIASSVGIQPNSTKFNLFVYEVASDIIRLSRLLEEGKLAESARDKERMKAKADDMLSDNDGHAS